MDVPPLSEEENLVRAFFCPEQHNGEEFLTNAVSLDDLKDRGFSVDRPKLTPLSVLTQRLENQKAKNPEIREYSMFSELYYAKLKEDRDSAGQCYFDIKVSPVEKSEEEPANPGHASIYSADKNLGKGGLRKIRTELIKHLNNIVLLNSIAYLQDPPLEK